MPGIKYCSTTTLFLILGTQIKGSQVSQEQAYSLTHGQFYASEPWSCDMVLLELDVKRFASSTHCCNVYTTIITF